MEAKIIESLKVFRAGDDEAALGALLEVEEELVPSLFDAFRNEPDAEARAFLVRVAWERREENSTTFIVEALNDPEEEVWQTALDGTVALASPEILDVLQSLRTQERADAVTAKRFQLCVDEAILYVEGLVRGRQHPHLSPLPSRERK
jgi:hypothetical protein